MKKGKGISQKTYMYNTLVQINSTVMARGKGVGAGWRWAKRKGGYICSSVSVTGCSQGGGQIRILLGSRTQGVQEILEKNIYYVLTPPV